MRGLLQHILLSLRLNFRSTQALVYGFAFPIVFLFAFWGIYNREIPPLRSELAQLITVTILSGACFGMPTSMVSERERGIWRRYRLLPSGTGGIVLSAMIVRVVLVALAIVIQLVLARSICQAPWPAHPFRLAGIFFFVTFAFLGLGLVIAMLADDVPAVQALGQIIFLPMLMIGGVGVKMAVLPDWARHIAAFMPGLYAVESINSAIYPSSPSASLPLGYCLLVLTTIGISGCCAGALMFRWDAGLRMDAKARAKVMLALAAWLGVGAATEGLGYVKFRQETPVGPGPAFATTTASPVQSTSIPTPEWASLTDADVKKINFDDLEPDWSKVTPLAHSLENLDEAGGQRMEQFAAAMERWVPAKAPDLEQRVRSLIAVAAIADIAQDRHEWEIAYIIFEHLKMDVPEASLKNILAYIAMHPDRGNVPTQVPELDIAGDIEEPAVRERIADYARKFLARCLDKSN